MILRNLRPDELNEWAALCAENFPDPPAYFLRHYQNDPFADLAGVFVAEEGGALAASVRVFAREIYVRGRRVGLGGIGEVCTKAEFRGRGLSGALLQRAVAYMVARDMPLSLLFTDQYRHYGRHGWFQAPSRLARVPLEGLALPAGCRLRPLTEADWPAARGLHGLFAGRLDGLIVRDHPRYWDQWVLSEVQNPLGLFNAEGEMRLWLDAVCEEETVKLREVSLFPGAEALLLPALAAVPAALAPSSAACRATLPAALVPGAADTFCVDGAMLRLNAPFTLDGQVIATPEALKALLPEINFWMTDGF